LHLLNAIRKNQVDERGAESRRLLENQRLPLGCQKQTPRKTPADETLGCICILRRTPTSRPGINCRNPILIVHIIQS